MEFLVRKAGEIALQIKPAVHEKGQHDYVTEADLAVSGFLTRQLPLLSEGSGVYSEEGESHDCRKGKCKRKEIDHFLQPGNKTLDR